MSSTTNHSPLRNLFRRVMSSVAPLSALLAGFVLVGPTVSVAATFQACTGAELSTAVKKAGAGDEIIMCNKVWKDVQIVFSANGTASAPVTLRAATPGQVQLTGSSTLKMAGKYAVVDGLMFEGTYTGSDQTVIEFRASGAECDHCRLTNSAFIGYNPASNKTYTHWVKIYGQYNRIDHNYFSGKTNTGGMVVLSHSSSEPDYLTVDHNYFGDRPDNGVNEGNTLRIGTTGKTADNPSYSTIESNYFFESDGAYELVTNKSSNNTYRYNTFVGCRGYLTIRQGNDMVVDSNFFFGNGKEKSGGIRITGEGHAITNNYIDGVNPTATGSAGGIFLSNGSADLNENGWHHYAPVENVTIAFNTIVNSGNSLVLGTTADNQPVPPKNITISNNLVYNNRSEKLILERDALTNSTWTGNIFYGGSLGITKPAGITVRDPKMSVAADGIYRPAASSAAVNGAVGPTFGVTSDMDGQPRINSFDVGADQQAVAPATKKPLTRCDVGPLTYDPTGAYICGTTAAPPEAPSWL